MRVERDSVGYRLIAKVETDAGGYEPGQLAKDTARILTPPEQSVLARLLTNAQFWSLPSVPPPDGTIGLDGTQWVLEGLAGDRYHVVDRWSPSAAGRDATYRRLAEWLLAASGVADMSIVREY